MKRGLICSSWPETLKSYCRPFSQHGQIDSIPTGHSGNLMSLDAFKVPAGMNIKSGEQNKAGTGADLSPDQPSALRRTSHSALLLYSCGVNERVSFNNFNSKVTSLPEHLDSNTTSVSCQSPLLQEESSSYFLTPDGDKGKQQWICELCFTDAKYLIST